MRHLSQKEIVRLAIDDAIERVKLTSHISQCPFCAERLARAKKILQPSITSPAEPSKTVLPKILSTYRGFDKKPKQVSLRYFIVKKQAWGLVAAGFLIALTAIIITIGTSHKEKFVPAFDLIATRIEHKKSAGFAISEGDIITTKKLEHVRIALENRLEIVLYGNSILAITRSQRNKNTTWRNIECSLSFGKALSKIIDKNRIHLTIATPHGKITALGTEFFVNVDANATQVFLRDGMLEIAHASGKKITLNSRMKCLLDDAITPSPMRAGEFDALIAEGSEQKEARNTSVTKSPAEATAKSMSETEAHNKAINTEKNSNEEKNNSSQENYRKEVKKETRSAAKESRKSFHRGK